MPTRIAIALSIIATAATCAVAADSAIDAINTWSGKVQDLEHQELAPASGFVDNSDTWRKLWTAWRPNEAVPEIDFASDLVLVGTVSGPNLVMMQPKMDDDGNVTFVLGSTKMAGPGFGYKMIQIKRTGVATVNGKSITDPMPRVQDSITVTIVGTLQTGIVAIGGETTGTTITANGITWELDFGDNQTNRQVAEQYNGEKVKVQGTLKRLAGVEVNERWVVTVTECHALNDVHQCRSYESLFEATTRRTDTVLHLLSEQENMVIDIECRQGIDTATISRTSQSWPAPVIVRLHLQGLESFDATVGDTSVRWSITSTGSHPQRVSLRQGGKESSIDASSPYFTVVHVVGDAPTIPLKDGYFEVSLPNKLIESNPEVLTLRWMDFYRN